MSKGARVVVGVRAARVAVFAAALSGCAASDFLSLPPAAVPGGGFVELTDDKEVVLRLDEQAPRRRFFVPVVVDGADVGALVDVRASVGAPLQIIVAGHPEQTSSSLPWSIIEDDLRLSFSLDDIGGARLPGVELGVGVDDDTAAGGAVDVTLSLRLRVTTDDPAATAAFGRLEPHPS